MHPSSLKHVCWDFTGLLLILIDCITVPLEVFDPPRDGLLTVVTWVSRLFWTMHIYMSFFTGILLPQGSVEMNPRVVAKTYCKTWLGFDTFLVVFDWLEVLAQGSANQRTLLVGRFIRGFRMFRTVKLVRMMKTPEFVRLFTDNV